MSTQIKFSFLARQALGKWNHHARKFAYYTKNHLILIFNERREVSVFEINLFRSALTKEEV